MKLTIGQRRMLTVLERLAADNAACPTNAALGERLGCETKDAAKWFAALRSLGVIEVVRAHHSRQVTITATGAKTADINV